MVGMPGHSVDVGMLIVISPPPSTRPQTLTRLYFGLFQIHGGRLRFGLLNLVCGYRQRWVASERLPRGAAVLRPSEIQEGVPGG